MKLPIPTACVAGIVYREDDTFLCIKRSKEPEVGKWTLPGGHVESGETGEQAVIRELREETDLTCRSALFLGLYEYITTDFHLVILIFNCDCEQRLASPGDDADDVGWFSWKELNTLQKTEGLFEQMAVLLTK